MELTIENNLDKECGALSGLFQDILYEMKSSIPNFDEFAGRAGKLHATLKNTITVLSSFLDSFQKIADAASSTKGNTRDIGTSLTRIVIRHRALESRMKTFAGALLDCLSFPIQGKSEEWKKSTTLLEKEHLKCYKKNKSQIKKKTDQVLSKELNIQFKNFEKNERHSVKKALTENRNHYSTFVAFLKPVLVEEIAMFTEIYPIEEVLNKLNRKTSQKESSDTFIQEYVQNDISNYEGDDSYSLYISTPPSTPLSSMGSRNASMSSLETNSTTNSSMSINNIPNGSTTTTQFYKTPSNEQSQSRPHSSLSFQNAPTNMHPAVLHRPCSTTAWDLNYRRKSHCLASKNLVQENEDLESINGSFSNDINGFSTV
ncbi:MTSS1 [Lepeophtheirus salmonis]|uniref:MTSS1 n=1 Tax=Lepeophtheirus salmonis TaxID=72036 RepID=A0A7R8H566_LEPSM|nr:MTSS1 [Lepeophtheirus salmonis]CAF2875415.1 MTSS1 [Lepeophtheirus salmonis]